MLVLSAVVAADDSCCVWGAGWAWALTGLLAEMAATIDPMFKSAWHAGTSVEEIESKDAATEGRTTCIERRVRL